MAGKDRKKRPPRAKRKRSRKRREKEPSPEPFEQVEAVAEPAPEPVTEPAVPEEPPVIPLEDSPLEPEPAQAAEEAEGEDGVGEEAGEEAEGEEGGWGDRLKRGMSRSRKVMTRPFTRVATRKAIDEEFWSEAEDALVASDAGVACATDIVEGVRKTIMREGIRDIEGLKRAFRSQVVEMLESFGRPPELSPERPRVVFIAGVNGVGKTTTAAKIGHLMKEQGASVLFAAADTFRAAGIEQMEMWAHRVGAPVVRHKTGGDPAAVVYDAVESAKAKGFDVVLVDTAGRLHTKKNLMEELSKMWRVADRQLEGAPEAILVIDATTGQNGVSQARIFGEALDIGSIALTKMDGSAKGGVVMAIGRELGIPVAYIGVGEGISDLRPFDPREYARALF